MATAQALPDITRTQDFLDWVWQQDFKFEVIEGRLVMMAGGTRRHSRIAVNATIALGNRLTGQPCLPYNSDFLVEASSRNRYFPDVSVVCGERRDFTDRPAMVIEVLSPTTQREDLGPKLENYLRIEGLKYLLYLWQDQPHARLWRPAEDGGRQSADFIGLESQIDLPALGIQLSMAELYADVEF